MPKLDIHEIAATSRTDQENENALEHFREIAFPDIAADEIISILRQNKDLWQSVWARKGEESGSFDYPNAVWEKANKQKENILSLIVTGSSKSVVFIYELKEYADDFSFTSAFALPDEKVIYILFFIKNN